MNARHITRFMLIALMILSISASILAAPRGGGKKEGKRDKTQIMSRLNLTEQQRTQIRDIQQDAREEAQRIRNSNLSEERKRQDLRTLRQRTHERILNVLTPEQRRELERIHRQHGDRGKNCIARLNLTNQQREQARSIRQEAQQRMVNVRRDNTLTQDQKRERIASIMRVADRNFQNILTPQQRNQYQECRKDGPGRNWKRG